MGRPEDVSPALLAAFVAVAEAGQFTVAAARLHLSQPAVSRQVQRLERTLGTRLLVRAGAHVELTEDGRVALDHARRVLDAVDGLLDSLPSDKRHGAAHRGDGHWSSPSPTPEPA